jgi:ABC-type nitrate/sulfonate/bicarbonate transport system ATPase subunit
MRCNTSMICWMAGAHHFFAGGFASLAAPFDRDGVGKSTTLKTIMGLVQASDGKVLFNGDEKS